MIKNKTDNSSTPKQKKQITTVNTIAIKINNINNGLFCFKI
jgi:hypothetical protein